MPVELPNPNLSSVTSPQLGNPTAQLPTPELATIGGVPSDFVSVGDLSPLPPDVIEELTKVPKPDGKFDTSVLKDITKNSSKAKDAFRQAFNYLPEKTRDSISSSVARSEESIKSTIKIISTSKQVISTVDKTLTTVAKQSETLDKTVNALQKAKNIILKLPAPTSTPPGIGIPLSVINGLSNTLDGLSKFIEKTDDVIDIIKVALKPILRTLGKIKEFLNALLEVVTIILDIIMFVIAISKPSGEGESENEESTTIEELNQEISSITDGSDNTPPEEPTIPELRDQLQANSNNPLIYKDYRLTLQEKVGDNGLTQSRIEGVNSERNITLHTEYSYATSLNVLVDEMKFQIDNYDLLYGTADTPPASSNNEVLNPNSIDANVSQGG